MLKRTKRARAPIHPGEILSEEFMKPFGLSANKLGLELRVPANRILAIVDGVRGISPDTALRLARFFGTSAEFWLNLQSRYDLLTAEHELADEIEKGVRPMAVSA